MSNQYDDLQASGGTEDHSIHDQKVADVVRLHPPGTFEDNTRTGDVVNGVARALGVSNPANVIKFPRRS